jgi:hypothetical protein
LSDASGCAEGKTRRTDPRCGCLLLKSYLCRFINGFNGDGKDQAQTREEIPWLQLRLR